MKCIEKDCPNEATKTYIGHDGNVIPLCEEHFNMWVTEEELLARPKRGWLLWFTMYLVGKFSVILWVVASSSRIEAVEAATLILLLQVVEFLTFPMMLQKYVEMQK